MTRSEQGARVAADGVSFAVWAPLTKRVELVLEDGRRIAMKRGDDSLHRAHVPGPGAGARYRYSLDGGPLFPDPASRFQPEGVHGPSEVIDPSYAWTDRDWRGLSMRELVIYELHVGTFTGEGTFAALRARLPELAELGVTAIELMPIHDFPGERGWGYDPAAFWAPCRAYGTTHELRRLVDEAHRVGLGVLLDVVYNHLGPDGAYWAAYGPVLSAGHHETPWGRAVNLDREHSRGVRDFLIGNALHWLREYHIDGLRLDATFALVDDSEEHFLAELSRNVAELDGPRRLLIAEDERNETRVLRARDEGGYGLDGVWADDFHHIVRRILTGDSHAYFRDFVGTTEALARCLDQGWFYAGQPSVHWGGTVRGTPSDGIERERLVYCIQNHDQIGNRPMGDRLSDVVELASYRAASALLLFLPSAPLLFMGQEYASSRPFRFFTDHEPELGRRVSEGRKREFADFPGIEGDVPDPQAPETFAASILDWDERSRGAHAGVLRLYRDLLALRRRLEGGVRILGTSDDVLVIERGRFVLNLRFRAGAELRAPGRVVLDTDDPRYGGGPSSGRAIIASTEPRG